MKSFPTLAEFEYLVQEMVEAIPPMYRSALAGVFVRAEEMLNAELPGVYTLGEYVVHPPLAPHVFLYYGSFARLFWSTSRQQLENQIWDTLTHELHHHVETLAGTHQLADEDKIQLARYRRALERRGRDFRSSRRYRRR